MPLQTLIAESEGVPLRIHRAAGEWARAEAAERLAATAGRAAGDRSGLRATQAAVAGGVVDLQAAGERTRLYAVEEPPDPVRAGDLPVPRPGALRRRPRRVLLRPRAPRRRARRPPRRLDPARGRRPLGKRQVLGGARRAPAGARRRGRPRLGALAAGGDAPGRAPPRRALADPRPRGARGGARGRRTVDRRRARAPARPASAWSSSSTSSRRPSSPAATRPSARRSSTRWSRARRTRTSAWSWCSRSAPTSTVAAPSTRSSRRWSAPTRSWSGRCAATSCAGRSSCPRAGRAASRAAAGLGAGRRRRRRARRPAAPLAALLELWQRRDGRTLRHRAYERSGGVDGAVARLAEGAYERLSEPERRRARPMLLRLAGDDDDAEAFVRRRVALDELELDRDADAARALDGAHREPPLYPR